MRFLGLVLMAAAMPAQQVVTTFAGTDWVFPSNGRPLSDAAVSRNLILAADAQGVIYFADSNNHVVLRLENSGAVTVVAGNGLAGFSGDGGDATKASLRRPFGVTLDGAGNLYIGDSGNSRVRKVTPEGIISTVAGNGRTANSGDGGPATRAGLVPNRIVSDRDGVLYITDGVNFRLRRVALDGTISTIAGTGNPIYTGDGRPARETSLAPHAITLDSTGAVVVSDQRNFRVLRIGVDGIINTIAGTGTRGGTGDGGPARAATVTNVDGMTYDRAGNLLLCDTSNARLRQISPAGIISTLAGTGALPAAGSGGIPSRAAIGFPTSAAVDNQGRVVINDVYNGALWRIAPNGVSIQIISGELRFKVFPARSAPGLAWLSEPFAVTTATDGSVYISDTGANKVHRVAPDGAISHFLGQGVFGCCADSGALLATRLRSPRGIAIDQQNRLVVVDSANNLIVRTTTNGLVTTIAGTTSAATALGTFAGDDGPATEARLNTPTHLLVDPSGNIIFSDSGNHRVRRITPDGTITTIAGNGTAAFSGDNGQAVNASLNFPAGLALNSAGELLIADTSNHRIRAVSPAGVIRTWAGDGRTLSAGDGRPQNEASFLFPYALASDAGGNVYVSQDTSGVIRRISPGGGVSSITRNSAYGFAGDGGPAANGLYNRVTGMAIDRAGNLYLADSGNNRIRVLRTVSPTATMTPSPVSMSAVAGSASAAPASVTIASAQTGLPFRVNISYGAGATGWLNVSSSTDTLPASITLNADATSLAAGRYTATLSLATEPPVSSNNVTVNLEVTSAEPRLRLSTESLRFTRTAGDAEDTAVVDVRNDGGGTLNFQASVANAPWLRVTPSSGAVQAGRVVSLNIAVSPAGLRAGTYSGAVTVTAGSQRGSVPVTLTVKGGRRTILLSQAGLTFTAVAGGGAPTAQPFGILNIGDGALNWRAASRSTWVRVGTPGGTVAQPWLDVANVDVLVNTAGLAPGQHFGQIEVTGDADNSPQLVTVLLNLLPEGTNPGPEVSPSSLVFVSKQGENPGSQTVTFNHLVKGETTFQSSRLGTFYEASPSAGRAAANAPASIVVQPDLEELSPGVRRGVLTLLASEDGSVRTVNVLSIIAPADAVKNAAGRREAASCSAPSLRVEATALRNGFAVRVGEAATIEVRASDECGNLLTPLAGGTGAQVVARPENGDPQIVLAHVGGGVWRGTWRPVRAVASTRLTIVALFTGTAADVIAGRTQAGKVELSGAVTAQQQQSAPLLTAGGVVHAASLESGVPIAPGGLITLFGARLADATGLASGLPLPTVLNGTEVRLGDRPLPLLFTSDGQLNAQVPYDVPADTQHQITVKRGAAFAVPETLTVAPAQPGVFTKSQSGSGQAAIVRQDGVTLAEPGTAARKGEVVIIYCAGLGPVSPSVESGRPAPASPLSGVVNPVTVTIGGAEAQVLFAGLAPGFSGLYQINAFVPQGSLTGNAVEVIIEAAGQRSRPVTIAVE
jgi:uncharacterized protein (TIGR03437 family)